MRMNLTKLIITALIGIFLCFPVFAEERHKLIVVDDEYYPPYSFLDENGEPAGFNIELIKALGNATGHDIEIRLYEWSKAREALEQGEADLISGMAYSQGREGTYSFSLKHNVSTGDIFAREGTALKSLDDLRGKTIIVQRADIVAEYMASLDLDLRLVEVGTVKEAIAAVSGGAYDYAALMKLPGLYAINEYSFSNVVPQNLPMVSVDFGMAVLKGNEDLLMELNNGLHILKTTGEYQQIYDKWISIYEEVKINQLIMKFKWVPLFLGLVFIGMFMVNHSLKSMVNEKTRKLKEANQKLWLNSQEIRANLEDLAAVEEELRSQNEYLVRNERELRESEEKIRAIVEALPDIVFIFSREGHILDVHVSDERQLLLPREGFIGKKFEEMLPEDISDRAYVLFDKVFSGEGLQRMEYELPIQGHLEKFELRLNRFNEEEAIGVVRNISAEKEYQEKIEYLSYHDQLTGLYNRHYFEEKMSELDKPENLPICLFMVDVNGLKLINDSFGHSTGDLLLKKVAGVLKKSCSEDQLVFRIGGDEFVILITGMKASQPDELIGRIKSYASEETINSLDLSISFGWSAKYEEQENIQEIFNSAENLMYKRKLFESPSMRGKTINAIINTLYEKNKREEQHSRRVSVLASELALAAGLSEQEAEEIRSMGLLHDIGKIAINESILNKEGKLTSAEYEEIKSHSEIGYRILSSANDMSDMAHYVLHHHERWDGGGYPKGLQGEDIPLQSRIISVVDSYDAMTSERSYRESFTMLQAIEELKKCSGTQFDPVLTELFVGKVLAKE